MRLKASMGCVLHIALYCSCSWQHRQAGQCTPAYTQEPLLQPQHGQVSGLAHSSRFSGRGEHVQQANVTCSYADARVFVLLCTCLQEQQQAAAAPEPEAYSGPRDVILVTDADTPTGELVTLQLILLRLVQCSVLIASSRHASILTILYSSCANRLPTQQRCAVAAAARGEC